MTTLPSILPPRRFERGGVSWVTLVLLIAVLGGAWAAVAWAPVWVLHYAAKQTVRDFMNQAIKDRDDALLVKNLCAKLQSLETTMVVAEDGSTQRLPTISVAPADVVWERDTETDPPVLHVAFDYTRQIHYPFIEPQEWVGSIDITNELVRADWGPAR